MKYPITYKGIQIIPDRHISDYRIVRRTWKERLFSRPWQPFVKAKTVHSPQIYAITGEAGNLQAYVCSFETYSKLYKEQNKEEDV